MLANIPRPLFVLGQLLYMHPVAIPLWVAGLVFFFGAAGARYRVLGWIFVVSFLVMLWTHAKPYYLAPCLPRAFCWGRCAAGSKAPRCGAENRGGGGADRRGVASDALHAPHFAAAATGRCVAGRPRLDRSLPEALTHDLHAEYGWPEQAEAVAAVYAELPKEEQKRTVVLTARYSQASAINFFGARHGLPRAVSGHMTYYLWGPGEPASTVIAYGFPEATLLRYFGRVVQRGRIDHPLANARERGVPIYVCTDPVQPLGDVWDDFRRYRHASPAASPPTAD